MSRWTWAVGLMFFVVSLANADTGKASTKKPLGKWKHTAGDNSVTFDFQADSLRVIVSINGNAIEADADYSISKDGFVFGRIHKVKKAGDEGPSEGDLFSFKYNVEKDTMTLS